MHWTEATLNEEDMTLSSSDQCPSTDCVVWNKEILTYCVGVNWISDRKLCCSIRCTSCPFIDGFNYRLFLEFN